MRRAAAFRDAVGARMSRAEPTVVTRGRSPVPLCVVVLSGNEERNLGACLQSVAGWAQELFVVDSGSTDRTAQIAEQYGASLSVHRFETHAKQWSWALGNLSMSAEWMLALDADQHVTPELREEIARVLARPWRRGDGPSGYYVKRRQVFRGRWIKHGGYYPKYLLRLFRRQEVRVDEDDLVDHHFHVAGTVGTLRHDIVEDNRNEGDISVWIAKHVRYAALQARQEFRETEGGGRGGVGGSLLGSPDDRVRWRKRLWMRLPLYVRPPLYFFYRYVLRMGFLDGKEGFLFHALQAFWYRLIVDIELDELRREARSRAAAGRGMGDG